MVTGSKMPTKQKVFDPATIVTGGETPAGNARGGGNGGNGPGNGNAGTGGNGRGGGGNNAGGKGNGGDNGGGNRQHDIAADTATNASLLPGETLASDIGGEADSDWVRVELAAGSSYTFSTAAGASGSITDTVLVLYDADGNLVAGNDDVNGSLFSTLLHTPEADGTYYIAVQGFDGAMGAYEVSMQNVDVADAIAASIDTTAIIAGGDSIGGSLDFTGDHDWYRVDVGVGEAIAIWTSAGASGSISDTTITVYDQDGNVVASNDDFGADFFSRVEFAAPASGTYFVDVGGFDDAQAGSYTINAELTYAPQAGSVDQLGDYIASTWHSDMGRPAASWSLGTDATIGVDLSGLDVGTADLVRVALKAWTDVSGITFAEQAGGPFTFTLAMQTGTAVTRTGGTIDSAVVSLGNDVTGAATGGAYQAVLQEVGHALGLGNAGRYTLGATPDFSAENVVFLNDSNSFSVMSAFDNASNAYTASLGYSQFDAVTPLQADIAAIHALYGLTVATRTGDDTYGFNATAGDLYDAILLPGVGYTIVDSGGVDTLDYSGHATDQFISLVEQTLMNVGGLTGNVSIAAGTVIEHATGGTRNDTIQGNDVGNILRGMEGDDRLEGDVGNDTLLGGAGDDVLLSGHGWDRLEGGEGNDIIDGGNGVDLVTYANAGAGVTVDLGRTDAQQTVGAGIDTLSNLENLRGSAFADTLTGDNVVNFMFGGAGDDYIHGGGGGGSDRLYGEEGNDVIIGGQGWDQLSGGDGDDWLQGDNGGDLFKAGAGNDTVYGGGGTDRAYLGEGADVAYGGTDNDRLNGQGGHDTLYGEEGDDVLIGSSGRDHLDGGTQDDFLHGGGQNDILVGGEGDDVLVGSWGQDMLTGGAGADVFVFEQGHTGRWMGNADLISDFNQAEGDVIDLSAIDAIYGAGDDAFTFIGDAAFSGTAGELTVYTHGGDTFVAGDRNGDGLADFQIRLTGEIELTMADFLL